MGRMPLGRFSGKSPTNLSKICATLGCAALAASASAQQLTVTQAGARLHAGPSERLYTIRQLEQGVRLQPIGDPVSGMLPVAYPKNLSAYVPASAVEPIDDTRLRVTRATRLIAPHASEGIEASWRSALQRPMRPGSELTITAIVRADDQSNSGQILGYMVQPPTGAIAYIPQSAVSAANAPATPETDTSNESIAEASANLIDPMVPPTPAEGTPQRDLAANETPTPLEQAPATPRRDPVALATNQQPVVIDQGADRTANPDGSLTPAQLEALYQTARASEDFEQELDALLSEHRRTLAALPGDPFNQRIRQQLDQRIAYLEMRIAFRDGPARVAAERDGEASVAERMAKKLEEYTAGRGYALVGKLVPSRIYDGTNLPKLYRLRSPDALGRTLGYVRPAKTDLTPYLNKVVGISGKVESGPGGTKIVTPIRVETIDDK